MIMRWIALTVVATGFVFAAAVAAVLGTMLAERDPPVRIHSAVVATPEVATGGILEVEYNVHRDRLCDTTFSRTWRDEDAPPNRVVQTWTLTPGGDKLGPDTYISPSRVPDALHPGDITTTVVMSYRCNVIHDIWPITTTPIVLKFKLQPPR